MGVFPRLNSLESLFDKEGLREFGARGLKRVLRQPPRIAATGDSWHEWGSGGEKVGSEMAFGGLTPTELGELVDNDLARHWQS